MFYRIYARYFTVFSGIVPAIIALKNYKLLSIAHKTILFFLVFTIVLNGVNTYLANNNIHNVFMFHIYVGFEFAFVSFYFSQILKGLVKKISPYLVTIFALICVVNFFYIQNGLQLSTYTRAIESIIIVSYCLMFFNRQSQSEHSYKWTDLSYNWINTGLLVFYSCSLFTFMFTNYFLHADRSITKIVWGTYDTFILIENILFAIAFSKCRTHPITLSH